MRVRSIGLALGVTLLVSVLLAACATAPGVAPQVIEITREVQVTVEVLVDRPVIVTPTPAAAAPEEEELSASQTLFFVKEGSLGRGHIPGLDSERDVGIWVYVPPFIADKDSNLLPGLATGFDANDDNTVFTIHINPDAVWSDTKPITAQDFVDWWQFIFHPNHQDWPANSVLGPVVGFREFSLGEAETIEGLRVIDDKTLEISLVRSEGWFPMRLALAYAAPARLENYQYVIEAEAEGIDPANRFGIFRDSWALASELIVSGPYQPVYLEPEPAAIYKYELNPNWWGETPTITRMEGTTIRDFQTMLLLFENGEADLTLQLAGGPAVLLMQEQPEVFRQQPAYAYWAMWFNTEKEPADDINLRKALLSAIEWDTIPEVAWEGLAGTSNAGSILPPTMPCFDPAVQPYPFDPEKAREYLSESKYGPTGADVPKIRILTAGSDPPRIRAAQIVQEFWRVHLGIEDVEIKNAEAEFVDGEGLAAMRVSSGGTSFPVPATLLEQAGHSLGSGQQFHSAGTPEFDAKIEALLAVDPTAADYCSQVNALLQEYNDQALVIPTAYIQTFYQVQPWLHGADRSYSGLYNLPNMYITRH